MRDSYVSRFLVVVTHPNGGLVWASEETLLAAAYDRLSPYLGTCKCMVFAFTHGVAEDLPEEYERRLEELKSED